MSGTAVVWGYAESELAERWEGEYDTREAAVVAGREHFAGSEAYADMTHFWVVRGRRPAASEFLPPYYEDALADDLAEQAYEVAGEVAECWPELPAKRRRWGRI